MPENEKIARVAGIVGSATLLSRILGLVRDQVTAYFFGAGLSADAFFVAFRIPNLLRRLLAEGALTIAFIPVFTEYLTTRSRQEALALARAVLTILSCILAGATLLGILLAPYIVWIFAPGFNDDPDKFALTVFLTRIMFPYIFLIGLAALAMGILNSLGKFAAPALAPVMLNLGMIGSVFLLFRHLLWAGVMGLVVYFVAAEGFIFARTGLIGLLLRVFASIFFGGIVYLGLAFLWRTPEVTTVLQGLTKRLKGRPT